jgi:hypothetical protein
MVVGSAQRWNPRKVQANSRVLRWSCLEVCRSGQRSCGHPCAVLRVRWPAAPQQPAPASFLPTAEGQVVICMPSVPWSMSVREPGDQPGVPPETSPPRCTPEGRIVGLWGEPVLSPPSMWGARPTRGPQPCRDWPTLQRSPTHLGARSGVLWPVSWSVRQRP